MYAPLISDYFTPPPTPENDLQKSLLGPELSWNLLLPFWRGGGLENGCYMCMEP